MDFNDISEALKTKHSPIQKIEQLEGVVKLKRRGKGRPPKPEMKAKLLRLNILTIKELDFLAKEEGISVSQLVGKALEVYKEKNLQKIGCESV